MEKVAVRRINEWDAPAVLKIYAPYVEAGLSPAEKAPPVLQQLIERIDRYSYGSGWIMCEINSTPAGFCYLTEYPMNEEIPLDLESLFISELQIYVKPEYQRRGVGAALMSLITSIMQYGNKRKIYARIPLADNEAILFFEKMGFVKSEEKDGLFIMQKKLKPVDSSAKMPTKPYLIENEDYESAREYAATLVKQK